MASMDKIYLLEILKKYRQGNASKEEVEFLYAYYDLFEVEEDVIATRAAADVKALKEDIRAGLNEKITGKPAAPIRYINARFKWFAAASVLLIVAVGAVVYNHRQPAVESVTAGTGMPAAPAVNDIAPGRNQAILTLADGAVIALDDKANGVISQQQGTLVKKTADGHVVYTENEKSAAPAINTITTPNGGQYRLTLPDGTNVWLNAASSITFPTSFTGAAREVRITGEAYFEVAKDKRHAFKVISENQVVEVLGTHFNVNTYPDEPVAKTTLLEGSVKVTRISDATNKEAAAKVLAPGQQSVVVRSKEPIRVQSADMEEAVAWKNGYFKFDRVDIQTIMRQVARWYDVKVEYRGKISDDVFVGKIARSENVSGVLRILALSKIKTSIEGRKIIVMNQ
jgi:transmembrane sensor